MFKFIISILFIFQYLLGNQFIRNSTNKVVLDTKTNLFWQDNSVVKDISRTYSDALSYCHDLDLGGYTDWRVPNINELLTISDYSVENPSINAIFVNTSIENDALYWSSTPVKAHSDYIWVIDFKNSDDDMDKNDNTNYTRCVRSP